jgi:phosphate transport system protein
MREAYRAQLDTVAEHLADMCEYAAKAVNEATKALVNRDLALAERVISEDTDLDRMRIAAEDQCVALLALQQPVAGDLRLIVSTIRASGDIERMGDLALHIAESARRRHPDPVVPDEIMGYFAEMGRVAGELAHKAAVVIRSRDVAKAEELERDDDAMDDLHRHMFTVMMDREWTHGVATAVDATLLARFFERYADHAVTIGRWVVYVATGRMPAVLAEPSG